MVKLKCVLICDEGFEDVVKKDLKNKFNLDCIEESTVLKFSLEENEESYFKIAELCYLYQGALKIITNVIEFEAKKEISDINIPLENYNLSYEKESVSVTCIRKGNHNFKSTELANIISNKIFPDSVKKFKNAILSLLCYVKDDKGYFGVDFSGLILYKRDYKIFLGSTALRSTIAYNLLTFADYNYKKDEVLLDPFMGSGIIPIEAGLLKSSTSSFLFSKEKFSFLKFLPRLNWDDWFKKMDSKRNLDNSNIYGFDSLLKFLKYTQKNAKIADINKVLNISKVEVDWIDTKIDQKFVDKIVTQPPMLTDHGNKTKISKLYKEFFNRCSEILKKKAIVVLLINDKSLEELKTISLNYNYEFLEERKVFEGNQEFMVLKLRFNGRK